MALDLRERGIGVDPGHRARVFRDLWDVDGALSWLEPENPDLVVVPPAWVENLDAPASAHAVIDPAGAELMADSGELVDSVLAAATGAGLAALLAGVDLGTIDVTDLPALVVAAGRLESWAHALSARVAAELAARPEMNPHWPAMVGPVSQPNIAADELSLRLNTGRRSAQQLVDEGLAYERGLSMTGRALQDGRIDTARARVLVRGLKDHDPVTVAEVEARVLPTAGDRTAAQLARDVDRALLILDPDGGAARRDRARAGRRVSRPSRLPDGMAGIWAVLPAPDAARLDRALDASAHALRQAGDDRTVARLRADALLDAALIGPAWAPLPPASGHDQAAPAHDAPSRSLPRVDVRVTVALTTLLGADDDPAELDGYGPIDAATARALALGGTWRRLVIDPLSGAILDVGRTRYRPPAALADHVITRDRICARPGCTVPATACDLDHTKPYADGGTTSAGNLAPLCRRDHLLRTHAGHRIEQPEPGVIEWITPTSRRYRSVPGDDGRHRLVTPESPAGARTPPTPVAPPVACDADQKTEAIEFSRPSIIDEDPIPF